MKAIDRLKAAVEANTAATNALLVKVNGLQGETDAAINTACDALDANTAAIIAVTA